ncbi:hypothetical protein NicSoilC12_26640 [Arthrobacter sp. NicSoilC12]|nr:hypothetical protein NicSoilC12_26640 [Arthrobacter sp. NicSoilC12]
MLFGSPAELPPPAPAQAEALSATHRAPAAMATRVFARIKDSFVLQGVRCCPTPIAMSGCGAVSGTRASVPGASLVFLKIRLVA